MGVYLPQASLPGLKNYKYSAEDRSYVSKYILKPFYTWLVEFFPKWMAPNLITLLGLGFSVVGFASALWLNPHFDVSIGNLPRWFYLSVAVEYFAYQTLDALDGQQARRTGSSSPLGELFDHCVDAVNTTLGVVTVSISLGFSPFQTLIAELACTMNFYLSTWEEYHTGKLFLSEFSGPVEGVLGVVTLQLVHAAVGTEFWSNTVFGSWTALDIFQPLLALGLIGNSITAAHNVYEVSKSLTEFMGSLQGLGPFVCLWASYGVWIWLVPEILAGPLAGALICTIGLGIALLVGRIITSHVTSQAFPMWNPLHLVPLAGLAMHHISPALDHVYLWMALGISIGIYGSFAAEIITEITSYLGIRAFSITPKKLD